VGSDSGGTVQLIKATWSDFGEDECGVRAAALAYYIVFALPPLLILLVMVAGVIWSPQEVQRALETQFAGMIGQSGAQQIHQMMTRGRSTGGGGLVATAASFVGLLLGATGAFLSLQEALNRAWNVKPDPSQGGVKAFITKRLLSMGMVLGLGFLLAVSLALTAGLAAVGGAVGGSLPKVVVEALNFVVSFVVLALLFAAMFKVLPDAEVAWRDVWVGGAATALLFTVGKFVIGLYLGRSNPGDAFGAASALGVILVWTYYSGMIVLFGAEFTQQWAKQRGGGIRPEDGAVQADDNGKAASEVAAAPTTAPAKRGGFGDWIVGLPVLYLIVRGRRGGGRGEG
jgi:membrane protein